MVAKVIKCLENPGTEIPRQFRMIGTRVKRKTKLVREYLSGNYTDKTINLSWEGKPDRTALINALIQKIGYKRYLEIGCYRDENFSGVYAEHKVGVDPTSGGTLRMASDHFFAQNKGVFDIIFIDGLHTYEQAIVDVLNSAKVLSDGGTIIMHDCLPTLCCAQYDYPVIDAWNGDVWKSFLEVRTMPDFDAATCLIDHGVGVIKKRKNSKPLNLDGKDFKKLKYSLLASDYTRLMNTMNFEQSVEFAS